MEIIPLNNSGSNYIGVTPLVKANNGKYYATYLTGFPYKLQSSGMKAFTISSINNEREKLHIKRLQAKSLENSSAH